MAERQDDFRPYAAPANIIAVLNRARSRNLPDTMNYDFLRIAGISENVFYRVMKALQFLNLVHEDGRPTDMMQALAASTDAQYSELLEKVVREAYRTEFNVIDPSQDPQSRIIDAFHPYQPRSQTNRMVMLFLGLCRGAGIPVLDAPRERRMKEPQPQKPKPLTEKRSVRAPTKRQPMEATEPVTHGTTSGVIFGITENDIALLDEKEFNEVWAALGKLTRKMALAKKQSPKEQPPTPETEEGKDS